MLNGDNKYVGFRSERKLALLTQKRLNSELGPHASGAVLESWKFEPYFTIFSEENLLGAYRYVCQFGRSAPFWYVCIGNSHHNGARGPYVYYHHHHLAHRTRMI